jgi:hypothetical protein
LCFRAHNHPIEHLAFDRLGLKLATGAQRELKVWKYMAQGLPDIFWLIIWHLFISKIIFSISTIYHLQEP